jgi:hypothetical protein
LKPVVVIHASVVVKNEPQVELPSLDPISKNKVGKRDMEPFEKQNALTFCG